jgi:pyruvate-ferredoxin/flavodoxin oxidoreductase
LFEDNAEFGLGIKLATDKKREMAFRLLKKLREKVNSELADAIFSNTESTEAEMIQQRKFVNDLKHQLRAIKTKDSSRLYEIAEFLKKKSIWIVGGDGWAYDIGFSGLDHVLSTGENVNILVMDTEVYSNTGGQKSKASPIGASAKFSIKGKTTGKKDLAMQAIAHGSAYVAQIAMAQMMFMPSKQFLKQKHFPVLPLLLLTVTA